MRKTYTHFGALLLALCLMLSARAQDLQKQNPSSFLNRMEDVAMHSNGSGLAIGTAGLLLKTTDYGENWSVYSESLNSTRRIAAIPETEGQSFLLLFSNQIQVTNDGGATWTTSTFTDPYEGGSLSFRSLPSNAAMYAANPGQIYKSVDGGQNWSSVTPDLGEDDLKSLHFTSEEIGWCSTNSRPKYWLCMCVQRPV